MKSPSRMSELIRAKKKLMQQDQDVIENPTEKMEDLQDVEIQRLRQATEDMDENVPKEHMPESSVDDLNDEEIAASEPHEEHAPMMPEVPDAPDELAMRKARLKKMLAR